MAVLKIAQLGNPVLRRPATEVSTDELASTETQGLIDDLRDTLIDSGGAGLSAPQVLRSKRLAVIQVGKQNPLYPGREMVPFTVLINPEVVRLSDQTADGWESCLSIPGIYGLVPRFIHIGVRGLNLDGNSMEFEARDFHARVIQHEVDHLDGVLFFDRMRDFTSLSFENERKEYWQGIGICPPSTKT